MEGFEERSDAVGVLVHERLAPDEAIADEERLVRDVLERGHGHRKRGSERGQQHDLDLEGMLDTGTPGKAEDPFVVDDRYLEVVSLVDLDDRLRAVSEHLCDQAVPVGRHCRLEVELEPDAVLAVADHAPAIGDRVQEGEPPSRLGILTGHRDVAFHEAAAVVGDLAANVGLVDLQRHAHPRVTRSPVLHRVREQLADQQAHGEPCVRMGIESLQPVDSRACLRHGPVQRGEIQLESSSVESGGHAARFTQAANSLSV